MRVWALSVLLLAGLQVQAEEADRAAAFSLCQVCHQADGKGLPGAFPPVRNRAAAMAVLPGGREYLIAVSLYGLSGPLEADGQSYMGFMAGQKSLMDADTLAGALNHMIIDLNDAPAPELPLFTAEEIEAVAGEMGNSDPNAVAQLRADLLERHPEQWPD